eukprot:403369011
MCCCSCVTSEPDFEEYFESQNNQKVKGLGGDQDVIEEEKRVAKLNPEKCIVRMNKLRKLYGKSVAVERASFALDYGECFALLGVSGAGKTTTFKCMTGEEFPTNGEITINGYDITKQSGFEQARKCVGYCPQFDAIFDGMTVKEHLEFYAKIKGIIPDLRKSLIKKQIQDMDLQEHENVKAEKLSGGNKRKLSVAMAILGNPPIIFLDEPSTGVDPKAKRFMWSVISKISTQRKKSSVIITTHSMDEAEALCTKMGIMGYELEMKIMSLNDQDLKNIKQQFQIDDKPVHLQQIQIILKKFYSEHLLSQIKEDGTGREIFIQLQQDEELVNLDDFIRWSYLESRGDFIIDLLTKEFNQIEVLEHFNQTYKLRILNQSKSIGYLFGLMEDIKKKYDIQEYSISQTSLEQIFNKFAKAAEEKEKRSQKVKPKKIKKVKQYQKTLDHDSDY